MSHGSGLEEGSTFTGVGEGLLATLTRAAARVNERIRKVSAIALLASSLILTLSVVTRYFLKVSTDWQDESAVFLLVGAIFMCGAYVQSYRGHVGIEALPITRNGSSVPLLSHKEKKLLRRTLSRC